MKFAERLKELRVEKDLKVEEIAKAIGVSGAAVSRWENSLRMPTVETLYKLCVFFQVSADYLIGLVDFE